MDDRLEGLAQAGAARIRKRVVRAVAGHRLLPGEDLAHDVDVLAGPGQRSREGLAVPSLDDLGVPTRRAARTKRPPERWSMVSAAMAIVVGVRADSWHSEVPRPARSVPRSHHASG